PPLSAKEDHKTIVHFLDVIHHVLKDNSCVELFKLTQIEKLKCSPSYSLYLSLFYTSTSIIPSSSLTTNSIHHSNMDSKQSSPKEKGEAKSTAVAAVSTTDAASTKKPIVE
nr:RNA-binding protein 47C [Tanacetum cinerariifolium]